MNNTGGCTRNNELNNDGDQFKCTIATHEKGIIYCTNKVSLEEYTCLTSGNISKYQRLFNCDIKQEIGIGSSEEQNPKYKKKDDPIPDTSKAKPSNLAENTNPFVESIKSPEESSTIQNKANQTFEF